MKYTKQLWKPTNFEAYKLIRGNNRNLKRVLLLPCQLGFEGLCVLMTSGTLPTDLYRNYKAKQLKYIHFKIGYKPYVLQRYII
jgi:hypothetical protein